jgi:hypothetical protein
VDILSGALLAATAIVTIAYWVDFFWHGSVNVVEEDWYIKFERSFPPADVFMACSAAVAAVGLFADRAWGVAWALVAAGGLMFLGLIDTTFNVQNGLYRHLRTSWPMRAELVINVWSLGLGTALLVAMIGRVS